MWGLAGTFVAVKVRHPKVGATIARDFALMLRAARLAAWLPSLAALRLEDSLEQFAAPLREQVRQCWLSLNAPYPPFTEEHAVCHFSFSLLLLPEKITL